MSKNQKNVGDALESVAFNLGGVAAAIGGVLTLAVLLNVYSGINQTKNDTSPNELSQPIESSEVAPQN